MVIGRIVGARMWIVPAVLLLCSASMIQAAYKKPDAAPQRVLFIGNSYTAQIKKSLTQLKENSPHKRAVFEFITKGGATLKQHLADPKTLRRIETGDWDFVVLQDQSQTPALPGKGAESFHKSADKFVKLIRQAGAEPVLFMTWGRRDGDPRHQAFFPDYETMQKSLADAYQKAAERNGATLAPVGRAWAVVMKQDRRLGKALYRQDGSHPSSKGAHLASCVFFRIFYEDNLASTQYKSVLNEHEWRIVKSAVLSIDVRDQKPKAGEGQDPLGCRATSRRER